MGAKINKLLHRTAAVLFAVTALIIIVGVLVSEEEPAAVTESATPIVTATPEQIATVPTGDDPASRANEARVLLAGFFGDEEFMRTNSANLCAGRHDDDTDVTACLEEQMAALEELGSMAPTFERDDDAVLRLDHCTDAADTWEHRDTGSAIDWAAVVRCMANDAGDQTEAD